MDQFYVDVPKVKLLVEQARMDEKKGKTVREDARAGMASSVRPHDHVEVQDVHKAKRLSEVAKVLGHCRV